MTVGLNSINGGKIMGIRQHYAYLFLSVTLLASLGVTGQSVSASDANNQVPTAETSAVSQAPKATTAKASSASSTTSAVTTKASATLSTSVISKYTTVTGRQTVDRVAQISQATRNDGLFLYGPYQTSDNTMKPNGQAGSLNGKVVTVSEIAQTSKATWAKITLPNGASYWMDQRGLQYLTLDSILSQQTVQETATVNQKSRNDGLFINGPYSTSATTLTSNGTAKALNGKTVTVIATAKTQRATWKQFRMANGATYWIDARGLQTVTTRAISNLTNIDRYAIIDQAKRNDGLFEAGPYLTSASTLRPNATARSFDRQSVHVIAQAQSGGTTWVKIQLNSGATYWIDQRGVEMLTLRPVTSQQSLNELGIVSQTNRHDGLFANGPYYSSLITLKPDAAAAKYQNQGVKVIARAQSGNTSWDKIQTNDGKTYWIDARGIRALALRSVTAHQAVNRLMQVDQTSRHDGLFANGPYLTSTTTVTASADAKTFAGQVVQELATAQVNGITWAQIKVTNGATYWIDARGLKTTSYRMILSTKTVNLGAQISEGARSDGLFAAGPYLTSASTKTASANARTYNGKYVTISQEAVTATATWAKIRLPNGKSYWMDTRGLKIFATPMYRVLSVPNYNQYKEGAPVGCEGVSLYQALRFKGKASGYSLRQFLNTIPKANSPYNGFVGSPFVANNNTYTAIFAGPLTKWAQRFCTAANLTGASVSQLMAEVLKGNPVVAYVTVHFAPINWGYWPFGRVPNNNHAVTIAGADLVNNRLYLSDPIDGKYWISVAKFSSIYDARKMAVVIR